jgi:hypothetical protein
VRQHRLFDLAQGQPEVAGDVLAQFPRRIDHLSPGVGITWDPACTDAGWSGINLAHQVP